MKRKAPWVAVAVAVLAVALWRCHARTSSTTASSQNASAKLASSDSPGATGKLVDPKKLDRGSIAGSVTGEDHAPIAGARVCADYWSPAISDQETRAPVCATSDAQGHYEIRELLAAQYRVVAAAKSYRPQIFDPDGDGRIDEFAIHVGEHRTGVDFALRHDGVEVTGMVSDVTGGPVPHAQVRASTGRWGSDPGPPVESDDQGKFSLWVKPGDVQVTADADGYAPGSEQGKAPGHFEILLTPESSLAGTVVDAKSGQPVAGVHVQVAPGDWGWDGENGGDLTDEQGHFLVSHLDPGRYSATARAPNGYGRSEGSTLVGLGQHVDGVIVKLYPAYRIAGRVVLPDGKTPCPHPGVYMHDPDTERYVNIVRDPDGGTVHADGVLPGKYQVNVDCDGYAGREKYPDVEIKDKDVTDLVWQVDAGAIVRGRVLTKSGTPVEDADVWARTTGGAARAKTDWASSQSKRDGSYQLAGLRAGKFRVEVSTDAGVGPKDGFSIDVPASGTVEKDLVLDDVGAIHGTVADAEGRPVSGVRIMAWPITGTWRFSGDVRSGDDGSFSLDGLRAGDYRVMAQRGWWSDTLRKPGSNDDAKQGERASVLAGKTAQVKLVVETQTGSIKGTVFDSQGKPVGDAYVAAVRESDAAGANTSSVQQTRWSYDERPVVTSTDGAFAVTKLSPGKYTLRAYRKGGGEAVAEHVAVNTTARLQIKPTGSLEGSVHVAGSEAPPIDLDIDVAELKTGFSRGEHFYRTDGRFSVHDLPGGHFTITATTENGKKQVELDLAEGEQRTGFTIELDALLTVTGRAVDAMSGQPVPGIMMGAAMGKTGAGGRFIIGGGDEANENVSDDAGRFTIKNAPKGVITVTGFPKDFSGSDYGFTRVMRTVDGATTADIGDIKMVKRRVKRGDPAGEIGLHFAEQPEDTPIDQEQLKVSWIDPQGPAAKVDIKVGDVVTSVDGIELTGDMAGQGSSLLRAPPGTPLKLGLARGVTVTIVLAAP